MLREVFSDCFAQKENYLTSIDARIKAIFVAASMMIDLGSSRCLAPLMIAFLSLSFLLSIKIPLKIIILRLLAPLGVTAMVALMQIFFFGYSEGLLRGLLILSRVTGAVSLVLFLSMTTPFNKLLAAARYFKVPYTWIEIASLTYRYIFVLLEDAVTIRDAQSLRLGYSSTLRGLRSLGELAAATVIKAYDHSFAIQEAMDLRGYKEKTVSQSHKKFISKDYMAALVFTFIFSILLLINITAR